LYEQKKKLGVGDTLWVEPLNRYRWFLEEYRVSLFAQQVGTLESVSEKRVKQRWKEILSDSDQ